MTGFDTALGYRPDLIGRIAALHANHYDGHWGVGAYFEARVAAAFVVTEELTGETWGRPGIERKYELML